MTRNLLSELNKPLKSQKNTSGDPCNLLIYCEQCSSRGFTISTLGAFAFAKRCDCIDSCKTCYGRGKKLKNKFLEDCRSLNPNRIINCFNGARIPARYSNAAFESFGNHSGNSDKVLIAAKKWVDQFGPKVQKGIVFSAPVGVGKTYILISICRALAFKGVGVRFIDFFQLLSELKSAYSEGIADKELLQPLLDVDVLVIDELGKGRHFDWEQTVLDQLVMGRYNEGKVIIASTNYSLKQQELGFSQTTDMGFGSDRFGELIQRVGFRVFSRLRESSNFIDFAADNYRLQNHIRKNENSRK